MIFLTFFVPLPRLPPFASLSLSLSFSLFFMFRFGTSGGDSYLRQALSAVNYNTNVAHKQMLATRVERSCQNYSTMTSHTPRFAGADAAGAGPHLGPGSIDVNHAATDRHTQQPVLSTTPRFNARVDPSKNLGGTYRPSQYVTRVMCVLCVCVVCVWGGGGGGVYGCWVTCASVWSSFVNERGLFVRSFTHSLTTLGVCGCGEPRLSLCSTCSLCLCHVVCFGACCVCAWALCVTKPGTRSTGARVVCSHKPPDLRWSCRLLSTR